MTHICSNYPTKKALAEAVKTDPTRVFLDDPSPINNNGGRLTSILARAHQITVTNHPKRSWFAKVYKDAKGTIHVE